MVQHKSILIFTDWYLPGYKAGGPIRSIAGFVNLLANHFNLFLFTSDRDLGELKSYNQVNLNEWINQKNGSKVFYATPDNLTLKRIRKITKEVNPDFVYFNSIFSLRFTIFPLLMFFLLREKVKIILAPRGMLKESALQFKPLKKKIFLTIFKFLGIANHITFQATDSQEIIDIKSVFSEKANMVNVANVPTKIEGPNKRKKEEGKCNLLFVGRIHEIKGLDILLKNLHEIKGEISLKVVGPNEDKKYLQLCQTLATNLSFSINVSFEGPIPFNNLQKYYSKSHFFILPTQGENFGHSIFESISSGLPVLISDQTPWRGLEKQKAGWDIDVNQNQKFQNILKRMVEMDDQEYQIWSMAAKTLANDYLKKSDLINSYKNLFN
jgi:glycosyltransferase involved in cell wall biosynthesis